MSRTKRVTVAALNIVTHPHSPNAYIELLSEMFALKQAAAVHGEQRMLISSLDQSEKDNGVITGSIARFTEISSDLPWFNAITLDVAAEDEVQEINIPEGLKPNYVSFLFYFDAMTHTFVFEQHLSSFNVSPNSVFKLISHLAEQDPIKERYGAIKVTLIQDKESLKEVFGIFKLREIAIHIDRPNPDDLSSYDEEVQRRLGDQNATALDVVLKTDRSASLKPDASTLALAEVATRNGSVDTRGTDINGAPQVASTNSHPLFVPYQYDSGHPSLGKAQMAGAAQKLLGILFGRQP